MGKAYGEQKRKGQRRIFESIETNTYNQKDDCMKKLIEKYCQEIWY